MVYDILQSSTQSALDFLMIQSSDHITGKTAATPGVSISKNGASFVLVSGTVAEIGNGWYRVSGDATDTNTLGPLALHATATSCDPTDFIVANIVAFNPQSATNLGLSALPTANPGATGGVFIAGTNTATTVNFTSTITGSLSGSVGSVTGNVGGNVVGTVASVVGNVGGTVSTSQVITTVTGAVGSVTGNVSGSVASVVGNVGGTISTSQVITRVTGSVGSVTGAVGSVAGNVDGNVTGSVGSVVGAVGSVTGDVGGNVTGSVGSVVGAVGSVTGNVGGNVVGSVASVVGNVGGTVSTSQIVTTVTNPVTVGTINASAAKYKKNAALSNFGFTMQNSATGADQTGLTVASKFALDGGSFSTTSNSVSEIGLGWYNINLLAVEMNGTFVKLQFTAASATTRDIEITTQP